MYSILSDAVYHICDTQVAVIPIVANVGAALVPTILAGISTVLAVIFKPKETFRLVARKPWLILVMILLATAVGLAITWALSAPMKSPPRPGARVSADVDSAVRVGGTDWTKIALALIQQEGIAAAKPAPSPPLAPSVVDLSKISARAERSAPGTPSTDRSSDYARVFRGDFARSGYGGGPSPERLTLAWEYNEEHTFFLSSPLVMGGAVYGATCLLDVPKSYGSVFCLDGASGAKRWSTEFYNDEHGAEHDFKGFFSSPALTADGRFLLIGQGLHQDANSGLVCLETDTGKPHWVVTTPLHIEGSPAVAGDLVVAGAGAIEDEQTHLPIGNPGYVFCVRISDGKKLWEYPIADPESSPAIADGIVYIGSGFNGNAVVALRLDGDQELAAAKLQRVVWTTSTAFPATGAVSLAGDLVIVGCGNSDYVFVAKKPEGKVYAFDRSTGAVRWETALPDSVLGAVAVRGGVAICPVRNGEIVALDLASGRILWRQEEPTRRLSLKAAALAGPAFTVDRVYASTSDGYLGVLDASSGAITEKVYTNASNRPGESGLSLASPFVIDGRLYIGSETGGLRCYVPGTGR